MAIRFDFSVDFTQSPRVITIAKPSIECTMQDLHDTIRYIESSPEAMDNASMVNSSGKETLDATTKVGLTVTLQNTVVGFEARDGTEYGGINEWTSCDFVGGNLVAVGSDLATPIYPVFNNPFVNVGKTSSSSGTLQEQDALQYSSYGGVVSVDILSPTIGTEYPSGNMEFPVNNIGDAIIIASEKGFTTISVRGNVTIGAGHDVRGLLIVGKSHINSICVVEPEALCLKTQFSSFDITGTLDGDSEIRDCIVRDLAYFNGHIHDSSLVGTIVLSGVELAAFYNCSIYNSLSPPIISCGSSGQDITMTNYSGRLEFSNLTGDSIVTIGMDAGELSINSSCTNGTIAVSGTGGIIDNSADTCYVINRLLDGAKLDNIQTTIEYLRPHHTGSGNIWYWDPYSGNDTWDGKNRGRGFKTFAKAHDAAIDNNHDIIICVPHDPIGITTVDENIVITKNYLFVRGPGRDFEIKTSNDLLDTINISSNGVEVSGLRVANSPTNTKHAVYSTGDFTLAKNIYIYDSNNGIDFDGSNYSIAEEVKSHHNGGYGIKVSGTSEHIDIVDCHIGANSKSGIVIDTLNGHEVNIKGGTVVHSNTEYGIDISSTSEGVIIENTVQVFDNTLGDINDLGIHTNISSTLSVEQDEALLLTKYQNKAVYIDTERIINGDGSATNPFNNVADTTDFAEAKGITVVYIYSDVVIDRNIKNFTCIGIGTPVVDCNGYDLKNTEFFGVELRGTYTDSIIAKECILGSNFELNGGFKACAVINNLTCIDGGSVTMYDCFPNIANSGVTNISFNGLGTSKASIINFAGRLNISDVNNVLDEVNISMPSEHLLIDLSCTNGTISLAGFMKLTDSSGVGCIVDKTAVIEPSTKIDVVNASQL